MMTSQQEKFNKLPKVSLGVVNPELNFRSLGISAEEIARQEELMSIYHHNKVEAGDAATENKNRSLKHELSLSEEKAALLEREKSILAKRMAEESCVVILSTLFECKLCMTTLNGAESFNSHIKGRRHVTAKQLADFNKQLEKGKEAMDTEEKQKLSKVENIDEFRELQVQEAHNGLSIPITVFMRLTEKTDEVKEPVGTMFKLPTHSSSHTDALLLFCQDFLGVPIESIFISAGDIMLEQGVRLSTYHIKHNQILTLRVLSDKKFNVSVRWEGGAKRFEVATVNDLAQQVALYFAREPAELWFSNLGMPVRELRDNLDIEVHLKLFGGMDTKEEEKTKPSSKWSAIRPNKHLKGTPNEPALNAAVNSKDMKMFPVVETEVATTAAPAPYTVLVENNPTWTFSMMWNWDDVAILPNIANAEPTYKVNVSGYKPVNAMGNFEASKYITSIGLSKYLDGISFTEYKNGDHNIFRQNANVNLGWAYMFSKKAWSSGVVASLLWLLQHKLLLTRIYNPARAKGATFDWTLPPPVYAGNRYELIQNDIVRNVPMRSVGFNLRYISEIEYVNYKSLVFHGSTKQDENTIFVPFKGNSVDLEVLFTILAFIARGPIFSYGRSARWWPTPSAADYPGVGADIYQLASTMKMTRGIGTDPMTVVLVNLLPSNGIEITRGALPSWVVTDAANAYLLPAGVNVAVAAADVAATIGQYPIETISNGLDQVYKLVTTVAQEDELATALAILADSNMDWDADVELISRGGPGLAADLTIASNARLPNEYVSNPVGRVFNIRNNIAAGASGAFWKNSHSPLCLLKGWTGAGVLANYEAALFNQNELWELPEPDSDLIVAAKAGKLGAKKALPDIDLSRNNLYTHLFNLSCDLSFATADALSKLRMSSAEWWFGSNPESLEVFSDDRSDIATLSVNRLLSKFGVLPYVTRTNGNHMELGSLQLQQVGVPWLKFHKMNYPITWLASVALALGLVTSNELPQAKVHNILAEKEGYAAEDVAGMDMCTSFKLNNNNILSPELYNMLYYNHFTFTMPNVLNEEDLTAGFNWLVDRRGVSGYMYYGGIFNLTQTRFAGSFAQKINLANTMYVQSLLTVVTLVDGSSDLVPEFALNDYTSNGRQGPSVMVKNSETKFVAPATKKISNARARYLAEIDPAEPKAELGLSIPVLSLEKSEKMVAAVAERSDSGQ